MGFRFVAQESDESAVVVGPAIETLGIGKLYELGESQRAFRTVKGGLADWLRGRRGRRVDEDELSRRFWALQDVSFRVESGEAVAIVGRNGSGKSTLLQILARAIAPTEGAALVHGRVGPMLAMGAGFNPEFTGRENIMLSGVLLGLRRSEVESRMDDIISFAAIGRFLDTPVKRYSSGMYIRLAFSVVAHVNADILLADEVLAVGDFEFQEKCTDRMQRLVQGGNTLLFVSHNEAAIRSLCSRAIYLSGGRLVIDGPTDAVLARYQEDLKAGGIPADGSGVPPSGVAESVSAGSAVGRR